MADEPPFYSPNAKPPAPRQPQPGRVLWTVTKGNRTIRCELRDDTRVNAGVDLQVLEGDWLIFGQRFPTVQLSEYMAASLRRDYLRDGWVDLAGGREKRL